MVEAGQVAHPPGAGAAGVEGEDDTPVPLRPVCAHHDVRAPRRRAPVDGTRVVPGHVLAEAVELRALTSPAHRDRAFDLAQPCELVRQQPPGPEQRQYLHLP